MQKRFLCCTNLLLITCLAASQSTSNASKCHAASFGIHFGGDGDAWGGWGPHYLNQVGAHGSGPYPGGAFGVASADWFEPGPISENAVPSNFSPSSMGTGSVNFTWESANPVSGPQDGFTFIPYGFANANRYVMQLDEFGDPILDENGHYVPALSNPEDPNSWIFAPDNGIPVSGEYAVLSGALFATDGVEYGAGWPQGDIVVTLTGLSSIASGYRVKLLAAAQNGDVVQGFTSANVMDNATNSDTIDFVLEPDRPSYWSPFDPDPANPYVSLYAKGESETTFTGDTLEVRLSGANEYFTEDTFEFFRTVLAGVIIDYDSIVTPGLPGDFNNDDSVDTADYVTWRNTLGDQTNYNLWREHYGETAGSSTGFVQTIPEPAVGSLCVLAGMLLSTLRFNRRNTT